MNGTNNGTKEEKVKTVAERREDIVAAMHSLCDALGRLRLLVDDLNEEMKTTPPGSDCERLVVMVGRIVAHLEEAGNDVPIEFLRMMVSDRQVGGEELETRIRRMIRNTMIVNGTVPDGLKVA